MSLETLLAPIAADAPGGNDICYSPEFDEIRKLRKGDDPSLSQGEWVREIRTPQWPKVQELCEQLLKSSSKDLQVACWLTEALTQQEGFLGLTQALRLLEGLLERFWETPTPSLFPLDQDERLAKLEWLDGQMPLVIKGIPMTSPKAGGYSYLKWEESRQVENMGVRDPEAKAAALAEGKLSGEAWDKSASASGQSFYRNLSAQIQECRHSLEALEQQMEKRFAQDFAGMESLRSALQDCAELADQLLRKSGGNPAPDALAAATTLNLDTRDNPEPLAFPSAPATFSPGGAIATRAEAVRRLREIAAYFTSQDPHSPVAPLIERAARWAEMPLDQWLSQVIKDAGTLSQLRELLDLPEES